MKDGEHVDRRADAVDEDVIRVNDRFTRARDATWAMDEGVIGKAVGSVLDQRLQPIRRRHVPSGDVVQYVEEVRRRIVAPDDGQSHPLRCRSMTLRAIAITSSCGVCDWVEAIARSTFARNQASCAAASSLVANSDSMGVRSVTGR